MIRYKQHGLHCRHQISFCLVLQMVRDLQALCRTICTYLASHLVPKWCEKHVKSNFRQSVSFRIENTIFINNLHRLNNTISKFTIKICLHSFIIVVRQSLAAFCSSSSRSSGTPMFFRLRRGLAVGLFFGPHIWKSDGAKQTARLLDVIWTEKKLCHWNLMEKYFEL